MEQETKSRIIRYLICLAVGAGIVLTVFALKGFAMETKKETMQLLHDAFFSAGALMILFSGLLYVSGEGAFLGIGYALGRAVRALIPFSNKPHETYAQYRERKTGERKKSDHALLLTGLFFFVVSLIFLSLPAAK